VIYFTTRKNGDILNFPAVHWHEATGFGRKEYKIKRLL